MLYFSSQAALERMNVGQELRQRSLLVSSFFIWVHRVRLCVFFLSVFGKLKKKTRHREKALWFYRAIKMQINYLVPSA